MLEERRRKELSHLTIEEQELYQLLVSPTARVTGASSRSAFRWRTR